MTESLFENSKYETYGTLLVSISNIIIVKEYILHFDGTSVNL